MGRYVRLDVDGRIISIRIGPSICDGEIETESGEMGDIIQPDGSFITPVPLPIEPILSIEDRLTEIENTQDLILLKLNGVIA